MAPPSAQTSPPLGAISTYLLDLHRTCHELPLRAFQERCLDELRKVVPFDSGLLATGTLRHGVPHAHDTYLHRQPPALMESWERMKHLDVVAVAAMSSPGRTQRFVIDEVFADSPLALAHCRAFGLAHVLCTGAIAQRAGSYLALSLYRHQGEPAFEEVERSTVELLVPHVVEAVRKAHLEQLRRAARVVRPSHQAAAIVNRAGVVLEADPAFVDLLAAAYPEWSGPWLPSAIAPLADARAAARHAIGPLVFRVDPADDLVLVHARRATPFDTLTAREREVARLFADGESTKEVAARLGIAANTVRVHLGRVYEKLGVVNKAELASMLAAHD